MLKTGKLTSSLTALASAAALACCATASAQPSQPRLDFVSPEKVELHPGKDGQALTQLVTLRNAGPVATGLRFHVVGGQVTVTAPVSQVPAFNAKRLKLTIKLLPGAESASGHLLATAPGAAPASVPFSLAPPEGTPGWVTPVILGAVGGALLFVLIAYLAVTPHCGPLERLGPVSWSFSTSWAANLTVFSALLGTILSAGVLPSETSAHKTATYAGLNLLFGVGVLVGPFLYTAFATPVGVHKNSPTKEPQYQGTVLAFLVSTVVILASVAGELATIWALFAEIRTAGSMPDIGLLIFKVLICAAGAALVVLVALRMRATLIGQCQEAKKKGRKKVHHAKLMSLGMAATALPEEAVEPPLDSWPLY